MTVKHGIEVHRRRVAHDRRFWNVRGDWLEGNDELQRLELPVQGERHPEPDPLPPTPLFGGSQS